MAWLVEQLQLPFPRRRRFHFREADGVQSHSPAIPSALGVDRLGVSLELGVVPRGCPTWVVMRWLGKREDRRITNEQLQRSGEFPRLELMFAQEPVRIADADCPELATRMKSLRESRPSSQRVVTGRGLRRFPLLCGVFHRNTNTDATTSGSVWTR